MYCTHTRHVMESYNTKKEREREKTLNRVEGGQTGETKENNRKTSDYTKTWIETDGHREKRDTQQSYRKTVNKELETDMAWNKEALDSSSSQ